MATVTSCANALYPIQHVRVWCKWFVKRLDANIRILPQFKINECEKIKLKVYVNQHDFVSDIQTASRS
jgi:hypothetical protein